jgi:purine catabolism regulator
MASLTLQEVLQLPLLRQANAVVLAGTSALQATVRWVHATELADIAPLLREGDLVLSTGIALPGTVEGLDEFARSLKEAGVVGVMLELGRRWTVAPAALVDACEAHCLPLISLTHEVKFAAITQAVGERVVDHQLAELREAERVHETFTELSVAEAGPREILEAVQRLSGSAVVLETEQHRVLDYLSGPDNISEFLDDWQARSRRVEMTARTTWDERNGWLITRLGHRDRRWGRLILQSPQRPAQRHIALVERAAAALALHRLHDRARDNLVHRTHQELLLALQNEPVTLDVLRRCELAGFPLGRRRFVGMAIRPSEVHGDPSTRRRSSSEDLISAVLQGCSRRDVPALVAQIDDDIQVLLSVGSPASADAVAEQLAAQVSAHRPVIVGAGRTVPSPEAISRTLREARQVVDSVRAGDERDPRGPLFRLEDVHIRGLLSLWGDDDRLQLFVSRELDALKAYDREHKSNLSDTLRALLQHESKADAAARLHLSRPAFYSRLERIERLLGVRLDDVETRTSLHVAVIADELLRQRRPRGGLATQADKSA